MMRGVVGCVWYVDDGRRNLERKLHDSILMSSKGRIGMQFCFGLKPSEFVSCLCNVDGFIMLDLYINCLFNSEQGKSIIFD